VVICAIDYRHTHIFAGKLFRCFKPTKACANNDDLRLLLLRLFHPKKLRCLIHGASDRIPASSAEAIE
jgi:hypothetical protein